MADLGDANTYPDDWQPHEIDFFNAEPNNYRELYSAREWDELQDSFYTGWLENGISPTEHDEARERWYDLSGVLKESFDWQAYREYIDAYGSPELAA